MSHKKTKFIFLPYQSLIFALILRYIKQSLNMNINFAKAKISISFFILSVIKDIFNLFLIYYFYFNKKKINYINRRDIFQIQFKVFYWAKLQINARSYEQFINNNYKHLLYFHFYHIFQK